MDKFNLKGTKTAINLAKAFAGETQARTRYMFYAEIAKDEGYESIQNVFLITADNERGHAEMFYDYLTAGLGKAIIETDVAVPIQKTTTENNLLFSAKNECIEGEDEYVKFAKVAKDEGFDLIAISFAKIATIEKHHEKRFLNLLERLRRGMLYELPYETVWECLNCGLRVKGESAPIICPACHHPQGYYKVACNDIVKI